MTGDTAEARAGVGRLVSGLIWNALGRGLPLLLALVLTPVLVAQMGLERWGLFTLALALVGVFGILDLGIGPALTRALSERMAEGRSEEAGRLVGTALLALGGLATLGAALVFLLVPALVGRVLNVPPALEAEAVLAFRILALAAPLVTANAALWGVLAAHQRFRAANLVTIPVSAMYYLGPVLVLMAWRSLVGVMLVLVACRLLNTLSYAWLARSLLPRLALGPPRLIAPLLRVGGWMTVSSVLNQALIYADRFLVGAVLTLAAVAHYATPLDLVLRMWILPVAVAQVLLPPMATAFRAHPEVTAGLLRRGALLVVALVLPPCLLLAGLGDWLLGLWLGADFAREGGTVTRILGAGVFFSCLAFVPNALLDAIGRPDAAAKLIAAELVLFLPVLWVLLHGFGIEGAALAWALRAAADAGGKAVLAARLYPAARPALRRLFAPFLAAALALAFTAAAPTLPLAAAAATLGLLGALLLLVPLLTAEERGALRRPAEARRLLRA